MNGLKASKTKCGGETMRRVSIMRFSWCNGLFFSSCKTLTFVNVQNKWCIEVSCSAFKAPFFPKEIFFLLKAHDVKINVCLLCNGLKYCTLIMYQKNIFLRICHSLRLWVLKSHFRVTFGVLFYVNIYYVCINTSAAGTRFIMLVYISFSHFLPLFSWAHDNE